MLRQSTISQLTMNFPLCVLPLVALLTLASSAQVAVFDRGLTAPTLGDGDTGFTGETTDRWGWDAGEGFTQTFTVPTSGIIHSIFMGYNAFDDGETISIELSINGEVIASEMILDGDDFSGTAATDGNFGEFYWMEFDLSAVNHPVEAGLNSFTMKATADTGESWPLAPRYISPDSYGGGELTLDFAGRTGIDLAFAVTVDTDAPAELQVTSTAFDDEGNFVIAFTGESETEYEVMKSQELSDASFVSLGASLVVTTDGSGAGLVTVPASEAAEEASFFRVEKRP